MATQLLVNVLNVTALGAGASTTVAHGLRAGDLPVAPTQVICDRASPLVVTSADATNVTITNPTGAPLTANFRCEYDHSVHAVGATLMKWQGIPFSAAGAAAYGAYTLNAASTTVPVSPANPLAVSFDTVEGQSGVSLVGGTKMTVATAGIYETSFSPQLVHAGGAASTIYMWVRVNGAPVVRSNSTVKMANNGDTLFFFISVILPLNAGDYVEWMIQSTAAGPTTITTFAGTGGVGANDRPDAPAVIAGIKKIGS